jgi:hypothetical protein
MPTRWCLMGSWRRQETTPRLKDNMGFKKVPLSEFFCEIYSLSQRYLGSIYLNTSARKWAIKEYPGQWFETEGAEKPLLLSESRCMDTAENRSARSRAVGHQN